MPIIDGYDDLDLGPKKFPVGDHVAEIKSAKLATGTTKNGAPYLALDIFITDGTHGDNIRVFLPRDTAEWTGWEDWQRKGCKRQLKGLGIHMSEVESEGARERLIGKAQTINVNESNGKFYVNFREAAGMDSGASLPAPTNPLEGAGSTPATGQPQAIVV